MESETRPFWASKWYVLYIIIMVVIVGFWAYAKFGLHACFVVGHSMEPQLHSGDMLECSVDFKPSDIKRGDIVVLETSRGQLVKRVIALPGESVIAKGGQIYIYDGSDYVLSGYEFERMQNIGVLDRHDEINPLTLSSTQFFCLGDNRNHSVDCRDIGPVEVDQVERIVIGKALANLDLLF